MYFYFLNGKAIAYKIAHLGVRKLVSFIGELMRAKLQDFLSKGEGSENSRLDSIIMTEEVER